MKRWLCRWLGITPELEIGAMREEYRSLISAMGIEHSAAIAELIQEMNNIRNIIPGAVSQEKQRAVRVVRHWREFRSTAEHTVEQQKPIRIERNA